MAFNELLSRITVWGTMTISSRKFRLDESDEVQTDGEDGNVEGIKIVDLEDDEDIRLTTMARKRKLLKRYQVRHETSKKKFSRNLFKKMPNSFLFLIENILKRVEDS